MQYHAPSLASLQALHWLSDSHRHKVRYLIHNTLSARRAPHTLDALSDVCEGYGVEPVLRADGSLLAEYINMGETYTPTIIYRHDQNRFLVSSMGDLVERLDAQGIATY